MAKTALILGLCMTFFGILIIRINDEDGCAALMASIFLVLSLLSFVGLSVRMIIHNTDSAALEVLNICYDNFNQVMPVQI